MLIRKAKSKQLNEVAAFVAKLQTENEHNMLYFDHIAYFDSTEVSKIKKYLQGFEPPWHDCFLLAYENNALLGVVGVEFDAELGRAWLHGPMVKSLSWQAIADELYEAAQEQVIRSGICDLELAADVSNNNLRAFAKRNGFIEGSPASHLCIDRQKVPISPIAEVSELTPDFFEAFKALHDRTFPGAYYSGVQILQRLDEQNKVFILAQKKTLQGYVYSRIDSSSSEGYIDFLGVEPVSRRLGIG
ncbi:MAG: GNAT family N-acetyltransferase, partial [Candidatus Hodarchaeales archaeon]